MADEKNKRWKIEKLGALTLQELKSLIGYAEADAAPFSGRPLAKVHIVQNPVEGDFLVGILEQEGIPALFQTSRDTAFNGIYQPQAGYGFIITTEEDAYRARTIIESVLESMEKQETPDQQTDLDDDEPTIVEPPEK